MIQTTYVCRSCSKRFRKKVICMEPVCRRCTTMCMVESYDEETKATSVRQPATEPILATARSLQARRSLR